MYKNRVSFGNRYGNVNSANDLSVTFKQFWINVKSKYFNLFDLCIEYILLSHYVHIVTYRRGYRSSDRTQRPFVWFWRKWWFFVRHLSLRTKNVAWLAFLSSKRKPVKPKSVQSLHVSVKLIRQGWCCQDNNYTYDSR